jgi:hypothetical protein
MPHPVCPPHLRGARAQEALQAADDERSALVRAIMEARAAMDKFVKEDLGDADRRAIVGNWRDAEYQVRQCGLPARAPRQSAPWVQVRKTMTRGANSLPEHAELLRYHREVAAMVRAVRGNARALGAARRHTRALRQVQQRVGADFYEDFEMDLDDWWALSRAKEAGILERNAAVHV